MLKSFENALPLGSTTLTFGVTVYKQNIDFRFHKFHSVKLVGIIFYKPLDSLKFSSIKPTNNEMVQRFYKHEWTQFRARWAKFNKRAKIKRLPPRDLLLKVSQSNATTSKTFRIQNLILHQQSETFLWNLLLTQTCNIKIQVTPESNKIGCRAKIFSIDREQRAFDHACRSETLSQDSQPVVLWRYFGHILLLLIPSTTSNRN